MTIFPLLLAAALTVAAFWAYFSLTCEARKAALFGNVLQIRKDVEASETNSSRCEQHLKLLDAELVRLQEELSVKKNRVLAACLTSLSTKFETWKRLFRQVNGAPPTEAQIAELKTRLGITTGDVENTN